MVWVGQEYREVNRMSIFVPQARCGAAWTRHDVFAIVWQ